MPQAGFVISFTLQVNNRPAAQFFMEENTLRQHSPLIHEVTKFVTI